MLLDKYQKHDRNFKRFGQNSNMQASLLGHHQQIRGNLSVISSTPKIYKKATSPILDSANKAHFPIGYGMSNQELMMDCNSGRKYNKPRLHVNYFD
jgi:hypothetical protein